MRKKRKFKKVIEPDRVYNSTTITKLIKMIMKHGKLSLAERIVYSMMDEIKKRTNQDPMETFELAVRNVSPVLEIKSKRIGGANYQVPVEVRGDRKITLALRWIIQAAKSKKGSPMYLKLADEIMLAAKNEGAAIKKRTDTHKMAEANKAFAHFAW